MNRWKIDFIKTIFILCIIYLFINNSLKKSFSNEKDFKDTMKKEGIEAILDLNKNFLEKNPYVVYNELLKIDNIFREDPNVLDRLDCRLKIILHRIRISRISLEQHRIYYTKGRVMKSDKEYDILLPLFKQKGEEEDILAKLTENESIDEESDNFLMREHSELIFKDPEYGLTIVGALGRTSSRDKSYWKDAMDFIPLLANWRLPRCDSPNIYKEEPVYLSLFQSLADFRETELILLLARKLEQNQNGISKMLTKLCGFSIPTQSSKAAIEWYNLNFDNLEWQGAKVLSSCGTSSSPREDRDFYILKEEK